MTSEDNATQGWRMKITPTGKQFSVGLERDDDPYITWMGVVSAEQAEFLAALQRPSREAALIEALTSLYDEQNGAPLWRDRYSWAEAMAKAKALISPP